jgi:hypothetical protein
MATLYILFFLLVVLGIAALRWGTDSADGTDGTVSQEWERRQDWPGIH